ncbi:uncharacterized protein LOC135846377 [Planococcus citri]|uniref:uncharacterized protein LOC135846377 n=1 Tax=Planococcus citri TaxID=170843 RepID=UPI0031F956DF
MVNPTTSTSTTASVPTTPPEPSTFTLQHRLALFGLPLPINPSNETTDIITTLITKLENHDGILAIAFARSTLEKFCTRILSIYIRADATKSEKTYHDAYMALYNDRRSDGPFAEAAQSIRNAFATGAKDFADVCTSFYKRASELIHDLAQVYHSSNSTEYLLNLITHIPKLTEGERQMLEAITSLKEMK